MTASTLTAQSALRNPQFRYRLRTTGHSSVRLGPCEVCTKHASEVFLQVEEQLFDTDDLDPSEVRSDPYTRHECVDLFGHEACLVGARRAS